MNKLLELVDRCEKAAGPDRELDGLIALATGGPQAFFGELFGTQYVDGPACFPDQATWAGNGRRWSAPSFTASLDAAMTLVPGGMEKSVSDLYSIARAEVGLNASGGPWHGEHKGGDLALSLCAAALRARASISIISDDRPSE